jgi:hypothetical protein
LYDGVYAGAARTVHQGGGSLGGKASFPVIQGVLGEANQTGEVGSGQAAASPGVEEQQALLSGQRCGGSGFGQDALAALGRSLQARWLAERRGAGAVVVGNDIEWSLRWRTAIVVVVWCGPGGLPVRLGRRSCLGHRTSPCADLSAFGWRLFLHSFPLPN